MDWGTEFCTIGEIFGFTSSQILEFSMPQFLMYSRYANEQKFFKLDIKSLNEYIGAIFKKDGSGIERVPTTVTECQTDFDKKVNNIDNIREAKEALIERTGRSQFDMSEIIDEIKKTKLNNGYRFIEPDSKR